MAWVTLVCSYDTFQAVLRSFAISEATRRGLDPDEVARHADTIAYELFCRLTPRVRFEVI